MRVRTAGSAPADAVRSVIVTALDEIGVPIGGEYPKPLTDVINPAVEATMQDIDQTDPAPTQGDGSAAAEDED